MIFPEIKSLKGKIRGKIPGGYRKIKRNASKSVKYRIKVLQDCVLIRNYEASVENYVSKDIDEGWLLKTYSYNFTDIQVKEAIAEGADIRYFDNKMKRPLQYAQEKLTRLNQEVLSPIEEKRRTQLAGRIAYQDVVNFLTNKLNELIWNAVQLESLERVQTLHECGAPLNWCATERPLGKQECRRLAVMYLFMVLYFVVCFHATKYVLIFFWFSNLNG